jgi:hypothetical protein
MNTTDPTQVTHKIDPNQREDLRKVYLAIHESAITTDIPEVATKLGLKRNYVKELVGILETHADREGDAFVIVNAEPGEAGNDSPHVWYQTSNTWDQHTADEAEHWFDIHFPEQSQSTQPKASAPRSPRNATNPADLPECRCGCKGICNRGRNYKPGHDARHAGQVARAMAAFPGPANEDKRAAMLDVLPTDALRWKAASMADRLIAKGERTDQVVRKAVNRKVDREQRIEPVQFAEGEVKIGRWTYPALKNMTSGAVIYAKKGQDQPAEVATDKIAATFTAKEA